MLGGVGAPRSAAALARRNAPTRSVGLMYERTGDTPLGSQPLHRVLVRITAALLLSRGEFGDLSVNVLYLAGRFRDSSLGIRLLLRYRAQGLVGVDDRLEELAEPLQLTDRLGTGLPRLPSGLSPSHKLGLGCNILAHSKPLPV